ncbi:MAG TPA: HEAT repeat domain-containing protein [Polyangiaceae bacterium]|jgi:HEAT repeat protein
MKRLGRWAVLGFGLAVASTAGAQTRRMAPRPGPSRAAPPPPLAPTSDDPLDLRARFGLERASHLVHSPDPDERLRGIERAASVGTSDAVAFLALQLDPSSPTRDDARAKIAIARGLAAHTDQAAARAALTLLVGYATPRASPRSGEGEDPDFGARLEIARTSAALALAQSGDSRSVEALAAIARGNGIGAPAALAAIEAHPPSGSIAWGHPLSPAVLRLFGRIGDTRLAAMILDAARAGEPAVRAAAIEALGSLGDARVIELARSELTDEEPLVRVACASALLRLGAPDASRAIEALIADDATARAGVELAANAHGPGVVRALSARAAVSADLDLRASAVGSLGRDPSAEAVEALLSLQRDPFLRAETAEALARSPSPAALPAIEKLGRSPETKRLAAYAYVVRAWVRGESSAPLETLVDALAGARDPADRAVGAFAKVALHESGVAAWLDDPDPGVRRAVAIASFAHGSEQTRRALLARRVREDDAATRQVLAAGLADGDPQGLVPLHALLACAHGGGADAALCALAFARQAAPEQAGDVDTLLAGRDALLRAHAARGLAESNDPTSIGRLAAAYTYEPDPAVRRTLIAALDRTRRSSPGVASSLSSLFDLAAHLDPDPETRWLAARAEHDSAGASIAPLAPEAGSEVAWMRLVDGDGSPLGPRAPVATAALLRSDGLALPIAFDRDGNAVVPATPAGPSRLLLAPRLSAAYAGAR